MNENRRKSEQKNREVTSKFYEKAKHVISKAGRVLLTAAVAAIAFAGVISVYVL